MNNRKKMKIKASITVIIIFLLQFNINAQESLSGLYNNPIIKKYLKENPNKNIENKTLHVKMPFIDDFSSTYVFPSLERWVDQDVFVNDGFGINTISMSCVTFDAFSRSGEVYSEAGSFPFIADNLTSQFIRLDSIFVGNPRATTIGDSIYLSFYYQPQGRGDKPETSDSLVVQFYNPISETWSTVWASYGMSFTEFKNKYGVDFKAVMIPITNPEYLSPDFRFRFYNKVSLANNVFPSWAGNVDNWNVDYVYLNVGRNKGDSLPTDVAFRERQYTLLKNYYYMPWSQFLVNPTAEMKQNVRIPYTNHSNVLVNLTERFSIKDISGTTPIFNSPISASNVPGKTDTFLIRNPLNYTYNSSVTKNAEFEVRFIIHTATIPDMIRSNDTMFFYQRFYNYYAYDDGTPEAGYALNGRNAQLAYQFNLNHPDTLQSVLMQFNRVQYNTNENLYFSLRVWNDLGGKPNNVIYEKQGLRPVVDGLFGFSKYELDVPLALNSGIFYIGWIQQEDEALNIGFDRNNNNNSKIFFNTSGTWNNTMFDGSLMIRPILGSDSNPYVIVDDVKQKSNLSIYPNPVSVDGVLNIETTSENFEVKIFSMDSKLVKSIENQKIIEINNLHQGVYLLYFIDKETNKSERKKIIISR